MRAIALLILVALCCMCQSFKILAVMPLFTRSHYFPFKAVTEALAERGHQVTFITPFKPDKKINNLTYVGMDTKVELGELFSFKDLDIMLGNKSMEDFPAKLTNTLIFFHLSEITCNSFMINSPTLHAFMAEKQSFDLMINEAFHTDCFAPLAQYFHVPLVLMTASAPLAWYHTKFGQPANTAYVPSLMSGYTSRMTFWERLQNTIIDLVHIFIFDYLQEPSNFRSAQKVFGEDIYSFEKIIKNASLLLTNSHFSYMGARPSVPGIVEVGGIHITEPKPIPQNIEKWINESKHGIIIFSMGSVIKSHTFPESKRRMFLNVFRRLKQRVLWKWENETIPDKPDNVMISKWLPQFDVLCHSNVKAFISHGGLLGTSEAVHCGVPAVIMPQYGDQVTNARALSAAGGAVILNYRQLDEEEIYNAITAVLEPEFNKKTKELSARFRDRPMSAMDTAIYWIEYVARHKGAPHLHTAAVDMPLYQYLLLDVFGFLALCVLTVLFVIIYVIKFVYRALAWMLFEERNRMKKVKNN